MIAELIPVAQWVYNLYKVTYYRGDPDAGGRAIQTIHIASAGERHLFSEANEYCPRFDDCVYTWEVVKENVGHPRVIGSFHGMNIPETSLSHGRRLAKEIK